MPLDGFVATGIPALLGVIAQGFESADDIRGREIENAHIMGRIKRNIERSARNSRQGDTRTPAPGKGDDWCVK